MDKILTVVIPTYNMERYLRYCLDSLCVGRGSDSLEVLVINDGSTDSSSAIAHEYEQKSPGIFRVIDKENGNYGSCVNRGLTEAKGKYIKILDADDSFDTENFEHFIDFLCTTDADLVLSDFAVVGVDRNVRKVIKYGLGAGTIFDMCKVCGSHYFVNMQMHAVTYKRDNLLQLGYRQTEGISYTDQQWIFIPMVAVKTVAHFDGVIYKYLVGRAGQTMNPEVKMRNVTHTLKCALDMSAEYQRHYDNVHGTALQKYLDARIIPFIKEGYVSSLTNYNHDTKKMLADIDCLLKERSPYVYNLIGSKDVSSFHGFEYINYWRRHKNINSMLMRIICRIYLKMLASKRKAREQDPMYVPVSF